MSTQLTPDAIARRAGGRRRYNAERQRNATERRRQVAIYQFDGISAAEMARRLNVSPATISRDLAQLRAVGEHCPLCGAPMSDYPPLADFLRRVSDYLRRQSDRLADKNRLAG